MTAIKTLNAVITALFFLCYAYQFCYILVPLLLGPRPHRAPARLHRFAVLISARNEEAVIGNLIASLRHQSYDASLVDIFVVADNCTDRTAAVAAEAGATVLERFDKVLVGKGYALAWLLRHIDRSRYDAFFVFDADNLLSPGYVTEMNKLFDQGFLVGTSYRNSKNFDSSWVSSAYALWFLREAKFLNNSRMLCGTGCAISGSGWMVSARIVQGMHGWDFHTLTEDIQFSTFCAANGIRIGYAPAEFYDEQPLTFKASWTQRMRWTKGFYQVFFSYVGDLVHGVRKKRFGAYDMLMTIAPGNILTLVSAFVNSVYLVIGSLSHGFLATQNELSMAVGSLVMTFASMYVTFFVLAVITTVSERKHIRCRKGRRWRIFTNLFTFPLFMMTYIPINVAALFMKVEWVPTKHTVSMSMEEMAEEQ